MDLKEIGKKYWENIDVDKMQPVCLGEPRDPEELKRAAEELRVVEEKNKLYYESIGQKYVNQQLFPE